MEREAETVLRRTLPHDVAAPAQARQLVHEAVEGLAEPVVAAALLVVSELVSNSIRHTVPIEPDDVEVFLRVDVDGVYGEVRDGGRTREEADPGPTPTMGLGLLLVEELATEWGTEITGAGRTAWFRVARDSAA